MEIIYKDDEVCRNFPEVLQHVREGKTVVVTHCGEPVAEISLPRGEMAPGETRMEYLERTGQLIPAKNPNADFPKADKAEGALERFLKERG